MSDFEYIKEHISKDDLLYQLAEESAELAQAALKVARKLKGTNPTPKTLDECEADLVEEFADVELCLNLLGMFQDETEKRELEILDAKIARWVSRLKENDHD